MLIKGRAFFVVHDRDYADRLARDLDAESWSCAAEEGDLGVSRIRDCKPTAVIIDASRMTGDGIAVAAAMRANPTTRAIPNIFIQASKAVDQIDAAVPGAIFASRDALDYALHEFAAWPPAS
jgi:CheY-like chemotaxis protein